MLTPVATRPAAPPHATGWAPRQAAHCSSCAMRH
ncbi:Crp/Fnr family transcriptional regulator, partial [Burkholderia multivorans]|nr:Crp/Fnr family transcriptional regulator [Burkholderia multivorans]